MEIVTDLVHDPVNRIRMSFERRGEDLIVDAWLEPGGGLPPHAHPKQVEHWSVVQGEVGFQLGNETKVLRPEDGVVEVPVGTKHGLTATSDSDAHLRCKVVPALHLQEFLEESAAAAREGKFNSRGMPRGLDGLRWAAQFLKRYSDETTFFSPPRPVQRLLIALFAR